jgi:hypothetical protein
MPKAIASPDRLIHPYRFIKHPLKRKGKNPKLPTSREYLTG